MKMLRPTCHDRQKSDNQLQAPDTTEIPPYEIWKEYISHFIAEHIKDEEEKANKEKMTMRLLKLQLAEKDTEASKHHQKT